MTQVKRASFLSYKYSPLQLSEIATYRYDCISKYKELNEKEGWNSQKAINFLGVKRSTFFRWLSKFDKKAGNLKMKTTELENKSCRPHNIRQANVITHTLVLHVLEICQAEPMYGKEKVKRILEKEGVYVSVSTVGRILTKLMKDGKIQNIKLLKKKTATKREQEKRRRYAERIRKQKPEHYGELIQIDPWY